MSGYPKISEKRGWPYRRGALGGFEGVRKVYVFATVSEKDSNLAIQEKLPNF